MEIRQLPMAIGLEWISPIDNAKLIDSIKNPRMRGNFTNVLSV